MLHFIFYCECAHFICYFTFVWYVHTFYETAKQYQRLIARISWDCLPSFKALTQRNTVTLAKKDVPFRFIELEPSCGLAKSHVRAGRPINCTLVHHFKTKTINKVYHYEFPAGPQQKRSQCHNCFIPWPWPFRVLPQEDRQGGSRYMPISFWTHLNSGTYHVPPVRSVIRIGL